MAGRLTGVVGKIDWSYYAAAAINGYQVSRDASGTWTLQATVVTANSFNLTQRPLVFVAPYDKGEWRWWIQTLRFPDGRDYPPDRAPFVITATLDPPDVQPKKGPIYVLPIRAA